MARAALYQDGELVAERGLRVPKRVQDIQAWSKAARKCFARELGSTFAEPLLSHRITEDEIRLGYSNHIGILIRRNACPLG